MPFVFIPHSPESTEQQAELNVHTNPNQFLRIEKLCLLNSLHVNVCDEQLVRRKY